MFNAKKLGVITLVFASFIIGGFALNAYQAGAAGDSDGKGHKFGFFKGGFAGFHEVDKDSPEWQEKKDAWRAKMEAFKADGSTAGHFKTSGARFSHPFGHKEGFFKDVNFEVTNLDNGVQVTITSDDPDIVQKLQDMAAKHGNWNKE